MMCDPGDQDDKKTETKREERRPEIKNAGPQTTSCIRMREFDFEDEQRNSNGKYTIAKSFKPGEWFVFAHEIE